jgi:putative cell wall-binding protein
VVALRQQGLTVNERVAGADRRATAAKVADRTLMALRAVNRVYDRTVLLSGQEGWADALVGGALSAKKGWPLLLTERSTLSTETSAAIAAMDVNRVFVLGGSGTVSDGIVGGLKAKGITVERLAGADRYTTALAVAAKGAYYGMSWYSVAVASGSSYADAIASGPVQARANSFVLLSPGRWLHPEVSKQLIAHRFKTPRIRTLGGDAAVNYEVRHGLYDAAAP